MFEPAEDNFCCVMLSFLLHSLVTLVERYNLALEWCRNLGKNGNTTTSAIVPCLPKERRRNCPLGQTKNHACSRTCSFLKLYAKIEVSSSIALYAKIEVNSKRNMVHEGEKCTRMNLSTVLL